MKTRTIACALRGRGGAPGEKDSWHLHLEIGEEVVSNTIDTVQKDYLLLENMAKIYRIRKLTPIEVMRLMGVSDEDFKKMKAAGISDSQCYKMAGNSIVVPVLEGIFTQMFRKDDTALF